jgi:hypothetical protein
MQPRSLGTCSRVGPTRTLCAYLVPLAACGLQHFDAQPALRAEVSDRESVGKQLCYVIRVVPGIGNHRCTHVNTRPLSVRCLYSVAGAPPGTQRVNQRSSGDQSSMMLPLPIDVSRSAAAATVASYLKAPILGVSPCVVQVDLNVAGHCERI